MFDVVQVCDQDQAVTVILSRHKFVFTCTHTLHMHTHAHTHFFKHNVVGLKLRNVHTLDIYGYD